MNHLGTSLGSDVPRLLPRCGRLVGGARIEWAAGYVFRSFGVHVAVRANRYAVIEACKALFPPGWKAVASSTIDRSYALLVTKPSRATGEARVSLYADGKRIARTSSLPAMLDIFEADLHQYIAASSPDLLFVHAGVVGWRGRAIVIPGRSFTGKTTLVAELVRAGATYYSDEFAVLDVRGRVHPFARPLAIRDAECRQHRVPVTALGGRAGRHSLPIGVVVFAPYKADASWKVHRLSAGLGVLALLAETVSVRRQPHRALDILRVAIARAHVFKGVRGAAAAVVGTILQTAADEPNLAVIAPLHACGEPL